MFLKLHTREELRSSVNVAEEAHFLSDGPELDDSGGVATGPRFQSDALIDGVEGAEVSVVRHDEDTAAYHCLVLSGYDSQPMVAGAYI